jgi:hypothetical protein
MYQLEKAVLVLSLVIIDLHGFVLVISNFRLAVTKDGDDGPVVGRSEMTCVSSFRLILDGVLVVQAPTQRSKSVQLGSTQARPMPVVLIVREAKRCKVSILLYPQENEKRKFDFLIRGGR